MTLKQAFENFIASEDFAEAVIKSTKAGFGGSGYSVELFEDGTNRVLWNNQIGNRYDSPGVIIPIPQLNDSDYRDVEEIADSSATEDLAKELRYSDLLDEIESQMREAF